MTQTRLGLSVIVTGTSTHAQQEGTVVVQPYHCLIDELYYYYFDTH